jgi:hypothetical protein
LVGFNVSVYIAVAYIKDLLGSGTVTVDSNSLASCFPGGNVSVLNIFNSSILFKVDSFADRIIGILLKSSLVPDMPTVINFHGCFEKFLYFSGTAVSGDILPLRAISSISSSL